METPKKNNKSWSNEDEEKYIDQIYETAVQISSHKEECGGYIAISVDTLVTLIENHKTLKQIRTSN